MSLEDDVAQLARIPTLRLLGGPALRMLAIAAEQRGFATDDVLFRAGDDADAGYVVQRGAIQISAENGQQVVAGPDTLIGELGLVMTMRRTSTAVALEPTATLRITRSLFQRILESDADAARRLRDEFMVRSSQAISDLMLVGGRLL
jgi:CRP-like cAMP-binding protein